MLLTCKKSKILLLILCLGLYVFSCNELFGADPKTVTDPFNWNITTIQLPDHTQSGINFIVKTDSGLFANFVDSNSIYYTSEPTGTQWKQVLTLDHMKVSDATCSGELVYCVATGENNTTRVFIIRKQGREFVISDFSDLPVTLENPQIIVDQNIYVIGEGLKPESRTTHLYQMEMEDNLESKWIELQGIPGNIIRNKPMVFQGDGASHEKLYVTGKSFSGGFKIWAYDVIDDLWTSTDAPYNLNGYTMFPVGTAHIMFTSIEGNEDFYLFHTITKRWTTGKSELPAGSIYSQVQAGQSQHLILFSDGSLLRATGMPQGSSDRLEFLDYLALGIYFAALLVIGLVFSKRNKNLFDYFKGGKRVPWFAAGISIVATKLSAISFIAFPAKAFAGNLLYILVPGYYILAVLVIPRYFIPFINRLDVTSVYEYLEERFNSLVRTVGSVTFSIYEVVRMGVLFLAPAIMMSLVLSINIYFAIMIMGVIATIYTYLGGLEAVIWTDVLQVLVMFVGALSIIVFVFVGADQNLGDIFNSLSAQGKLKMIDLDFNLVDATLLVFFLSWVGGMKDYMANQTVVQRLIATKNAKEATKSILISGVGGILIICTFLFLGTSLFVFYQSHPERLVPTMDKNDSILPWFIIKELPAGLSGILVAAVFAAAMSSLDSAMNSVSSLFITDIYKRYFRYSTEERSFQLGKILTIVFGVFGTLVALILARLDIKSLIDQFFAFLGLFGSGLGGLFVLGIFTRRANSIGALSGFILSSIGQYLLQQYTNVNVFVFLFTGMAICFIAGYIISILTGGQQKELKGLTIFTLNDK